MKQFSELYQLLAQRYKLEVIILASAVVVAAISIIVFITPEKTVAGSKISFSHGVTSGERASSIVVEISGSVTHPGLYTFSSTGRLNDLMIKAGGFSVDADQDFFARNFNRARYLSDQEKIYIPSRDEIASGIFLENQKVIDLTSPSISQGTNTVDTTHTSNLISINSATVDELDALPGVGQVTAQKIIDNRPYSTLSQLVEKKVLKQNVFDQVKTTISL